MAKRRGSTAPAGDHIRTSINLARSTHARLSALASLRGCSLNAIICEAADEIARQVVVVDKRGKSADSGDLPARGKGSVVTPDDLNGRDEIEGVAA